MSKYTHSLGNVKLTYEQKQYIDSLERGQKAQIVRNAINRKMKEEN